MVAPVSFVPDADLVTRIRAGDEPAFEALFREHYTKLCVFAARLIGSDAAAEEIVQDVLLSIWRRHEQWDVPGTVASYLYAAVRNRAFNQLRDERQRRHKRAQLTQELTILGQDANRIEADDVVRSEELARAIARAIEELPPRCREAFLLRRQHNLSYAEIARVMQIAPKTVEIQIGAAYKSLRKKLAEWM